MIVQIKIDKLLRDNLNISILIIQNESNIHNGNPAKIITWGGVKNLSLPTSKCHCMSIASPILAIRWYNVRKIQKK